MVDVGENPPNDTALTNQAPRMLNAATWAASRFAAGMQRWRGSRFTEGFGILTYHRVAENTRGVAPPTWNVTPKQLERQLAGLLARGFQAWPLSKLLRDHGAAQPIPSNVFAVTFDDGYENNLLRALPVLRALGVPATIFLATKYLDTGRPFPFDDWSAAGSHRVPPDAWRPLTTDQCQELLDSSIFEIGAHTHSHARFLGRCDDFRHDLGLCLELLRARFGIERPAFSFPFGASSPELIGAAKQLGVTCCMTTRRRRVLLGDDVHSLGRFAAETNDTPDVLAAKLSGWYTTVATTVKLVMHPCNSIARAAASLSSVLPTGACGE